MNQEFPNNKLVSNACTENDSILDFKSPKSKITKTKLSEFTKSNVKKQKKKMTTNFKHFATNHKEIQFKQYSERYKSLKESQPSIESSFFKPKDDSNNKDLTSNVKMALVCPLCFKTFKDLDSQVLHMKICALKNNISTKKLINAIELQKRQEDERKSLGLLAAPIVQDKKKPIPRRTNLNEDSDLQLALALSKSLQEAEELDEISEIERLSEVPCQSVPEISELVYKRQLEQFGFASSKPPSFTKNKKKKYSGVTVLQLRSQEERNQILTERIAEILMGDEPVTQKQKEEIQCNQEIKVEVVLKSDLLQKLCCKEKKLWDKAKLAPSQKCFYVKNLSEYISSSEIQVKAEEENMLYEINDLKSNQNKTKTYNNDKTFNEVAEIDLCPINERYKKYENRQFTDALIIDWGNALNDSSASDIIIFVNNDRYIWAHKLVFYVRCSNLLLDVIPNDSSLFTVIKEKICWFDIPYNIALAFLEFIYCGIIRKYVSIFNDLTNFSCLRNFARKYKVKELFAYLQKKEVEVKQTKVHIQDAKDTEQILVPENSICNKKEYKLNESKKFNKKLETSITNKSEFVENELKHTSFVSKTQSSVATNLNTQKLEEDASIERSVDGKIDYLSKMNVVQQFNASPDMFDDTNDAMLNYREKSSDHIGCDHEMEKDEDRRFTIFNSVNETIESVNPCKALLSKNDEECMNSLLNTPYSSKSIRNNINCCDVIKLKSNLSLFIEEFQKENVKSDSEVDSELSILSICPKLNRNPFNIRQHDNSDEYLTPNENDVMKEIEGKRQGVLNKLNYDLTSSKLNTKTVSMESNINISFNSESMDSLTQLAEHSEQNCRDKYTKNNLISKNANSVDNKVQHERTPVTPKNLFKKDMNIKDLRYNENENSMSSDFDVDEDEISMYTRYKKGHQNNSITKYRDFVKKCISNDSIDYSSIDEHEKQNNMDNEDITLLSDTNISNFITSKKEQFNHIEKKNSISNLVKSVQIHYQNSQSYNLNDKINVNNKDEQYFSSIQGVNNSSKLVLLTQPETNKFESTEHILVCSSPELDPDISNMNICNDSNAHKSILDLQESDDNSHNFENDIHLSNVHINDDSNSDDRSNILLPVTKNINQLHECNSTQLYKRSKEETSSLVLKKNNNLITTENSFVEKLEHIEKPLTMRQSIRKFQRKSMSEASLNITVKSTKNNLYSRCGYKRTLRTNKSPVIIRDTITPPPNYNDMKTSELHAELNKYGLKIQKRKRAVKLLTFIYNELHPTVDRMPQQIESDIAIISSEDEEPPIKKISCSKSDIECSNEDDELSLSYAGTVTLPMPVNIINEERQFDESESVTIDNNTLNIKEAFLNLIQVKKELYNNILAYEPLCINSLHSMLKEEGLKCKMNTLMDFLDEQCITFYFQEMKQKGIKKK